MLGKQDRYARMMTFSVACCVILSAYLMRTQLDDIDRYIDPIVWKWLSSFPNYILRNPRVMVLLFYYTRNTIATNGGAKINISHNCRLNKNVPLN